MKKKVIALIMLFACCLVGCSTASVESPVEKKSFVVGLDDTFAPMGFKDSSGEIVGFDVDLAKEVANRNGYEVTFTNVDWDLKETELANGNIDCIWNGYSITEERKQNVLFSDPYMENSQLIITLNDSGISSKADLAGKVVSVQKNSSAYDAVSQDEAFVASLQNGELVQFDTNNDCFMDLEAGRSDAIVVDETLARYYIKQQPENIYTILDENFGTEEYAVGLRKEDEAFANVINTTLAEMKADGTFDEIRNRWFEE
ncbi:MAG TPA: amino acid ABC transporter substrate-binding protein [Candidatus Fimiplasma intestinipullorum]|uniref:Amino acid ABC transporter substrate-binding protein n=1 Tax=Candidatus Fimiplasma intestinipullorum TaxID=2840825 RepID=A0A9D1HQL8_9FIRM|nr:amino acid ABC transporter substrate-binding protein [Candidatus Fimiplasma intestinipullorum]